MSVELPILVQESDLTRRLLAAGLERVHRGKVRDTFDLGDGRLLVVASNRVSIFDFVLNALVALKGEVLTALTVYWLTEVLKDVRHHMITYGAGIDQYLPAGLRGDKELQKRALVVKKLNMVPVEAITRNILTGSGYSTYKAEGSVCGVPLPPGLENGSLLDEPIYTPTDKAETGHDQNIDVEVADRKFGTEIGRLSLEYFGRAVRFAATRQLIIADTKLEWGYDSDDELSLGDEVLTPDSSRVLDAQEYEKRKPGKLPPPFDKQMVRNWGLEVLIPATLEIDGEAVGEGVVGINKLDPEVAKHLEFVHSLTVPAELIRQTTERYQQLFARLTATSLEQFQKYQMRIG